MRFAVLGVAATSIIAICVTAFKVDEMASTHTVVYLVTAPGMEDTPDSAPGNNQAKASPRVNPKVNIDYIDQNNQYQSVSGVQLPWRKSFTSHDTRVFYVTGSYDKSRAKITAILMVDGKVVQKNTQPWISRCIATKHDI